MASGFVRHAKGADVARLAVIERDAASLFSLEDLPRNLRTRTLPRKVLERGLENGLLWVIVDPTDVPFGFLLASPVDGHFHIAEMSVDPSCGRRGYGSRLLEAALRDAKQRFYRIATLTTFSHLPWNAPFYLRRGFEPLDEARLGPELSLILANERALGFGHRVVLSYDLGALETDEAPAGESED